MLRTILLFLLCLIIICFSGCGLISSNKDFPQIVGDGTGGAIIVYEIDKGNDICDLMAQRISSGGEFLWPQNGVLIDSGYLLKGEYYNIRMLDDGDGGAFVCWGKYKTRPDMKSPSRERLRSYVTVISHLSLNGQILWQKELTEVYYMVRDSSGGLFITLVEDISNNLFLLRLSKDGDSAWGNDHPPLTIGHCTNSNLEIHSLVSDLQGNAYLTWQDGHDIIAQKVSSDGELLWGSEGILACEDKGSQPSIVTDNSGGAIITWQYVESDEFGDSRMPPQIYTQKISSEGNLLWTQSGKPVPGGSYETPFIVSDGSGGAIMVWRIRMALYAQRVNADGDFPWGQNATQIWNGGNLPQSPIVKIVEDGKGGAIVVWNYVEAGKKVDSSFTRRAQRLDQSGNKLWEDDGILVTPVNDKSGIGISISSDYKEGVLIAWAFGGSAYRWQEPHFQKVDSAGNRFWGDEGIQVLQLRESE